MQMLDALKDAAAAGVVLLLWIDAERVMCHIIPHYHLDIYVYTSHCSNLTAGWLVLMLCNGLYLV